MAKDYKRGELRSFRSKIATLKKQGLIPGSVDARSAFPKQKRAGKTLQSYISKYDDVLSNKVTAVKVPANKLKQFRKAGFETAQGRVLVPHSEVETVKYVKGTFEIRHPSGIERVQIPVEYHNLAQYFRDIRKNERAINAMKSRNEFFGFRFFGNNSSEFYEDIDLLLEKLEEYDDVNKGKTNHAKGREIYKHLEILRLNSKAMRGWQTPSEKYHKKTKAAAKRANKRWREKHPEENAELSAERMRKYRANIKGKKLQDYKRKARARAKKSSKARRKK